MNTFQSQQSCLHDLRLTPSCWWAQCALQVLMIGLVSIKWEEESWLLLFQKCISSDSIVPHLAANALLTGCPCLTVTISPRLATGPNRPARLCCQLFMVIIPLGIFVWLVILIVQSASAERDPVGISIALILSILSTIQCCRGNNPHTFVRSSVRSADSGVAQPLRPWSELLHKF